jgi:hypothetical protein
MPFKSKAQRRKFAQLLVEGKIAPEVYEEWNQETGRATLPERVKKGAREKTIRRAPEQREAKGHAQALNDGARHHSCRIYQRCCDTLCMSALRMVECVTPCAHASVFSHRMSGE